MYCKGTIRGPKDTSCDRGGMDMELTFNYPFEPPKMICDTSVWRPRVKASEREGICDPKEL